MRAFVRAAFAAALVLLLSVPVIAADKPFKATTSPTRRSNWKPRSRPKRGR
jgi:hypothetical protein